MHMHPIVSACGTATYKTVKFISKILQNYCGKTWSFLRIVLKYWFRYVDDVHSVTRKDQVNKLQEHLNSIDPHIKFTIDHPGTDGLPFLDTLTKPTPNSIESTVYRIPTHTDRYLDYNSIHPILAKPSVIHTLIHRAKQVFLHLNSLQKKWITFTKSYKTTTTQQLYPSHFSKTICYPHSHPHSQTSISTPEFLAKEMDHLHKVLQDNHYATKFFYPGKPQQIAKPIHSKVYRRSKSYHTIHQRP